MGSVYTLIKSRNNNLVFSISPSGDIEKCTNIFYADVKKWCEEEGFADYIIPQLYYGFLNENMPFKETAEEWNNLHINPSVKIICGLAPYKCGKKDEFAGKGADEWQKNTDILARQTEYIYETLKWDGISLFSYSFCFDENIIGNSKKEIKNLVDMLKLRYNNR